MTKQYVIYSDLDGSLLDHETYSHAAADECLQQLESNGVPVVPCTSKTRTELQTLRKSLSNHHPFIFENGAGVAIPQGYFQRDPDQVQEADGFWIRSFCQPRTHWLSLLDKVGPPFKDDFIGFSELDDLELAKLTGLSLEKARQARQREYGEPVHWTGTDKRLSEFIDALENRGATVLKGGRFIHVSGTSDKGRALRWLNNEYAKARGGSAPLSIAAGDSQNDVAMLEVAERAVVIRSPAHQPPRLQRKENVFFTHAFGPEGWVEGISHFLEFD